ncbi:MAG: AraC family transcriptional regulator [Clostridiales bacterium]|nr:AraC family transcriptional regulator [Clostridiales bacterium]
MKAKEIRFEENNLEPIKPILAGFPISVFYTSFRSDTYHCINWHWHEGFQYCLVTEGSVDFLLPNTRYRVKTGDGIFINTQQVHFSKGSTDDPSAYLCLDIPPSFLYPDERSRIYEKYIKPVVRNPRPPVLLLSDHTPKGHELIRRIQNIQTLLKEEPEYMELSIYDQILHMWRMTFHLLSEVNPLPETTYDTNDRLKQILQYMQDHYAEKITLEDIARHLSVSGSECCRFFKKATGQSIFSYLKSLRVNKSMALLQGTNMSLSEIAVATGFCNQSYYTDCFRKIKNITPRKYRELTLRNPSNVLPHDIHQE